MHPSDKEKEDLFLVRTGSIVEERSFSYKLHHQNEKDVYATLEVPAHFRAKVDGFVPRMKNVNLRIVCEGRGGLLSRVRSATSSTTRTRKTSMRLSRCGWRERAGWGRKT